MKLLILTLVFSFGFGLTAGCQTTSRDSVKKAMPVEQVEGFWSVVGYLGGKLTDELGSRLNITEKKDEGVPTKVNLKLGWIEFSRTDRRKLQ